MNKKRRMILKRIITMVLIVCMVCSNAVMAYADEAVASTMRLTKAQGTVSVTNKNGRDMGTMNDMKLFNGYQLATSTVSYAWINLDDSKLIKLDAVSEAEIQKKGKDLEVLLNSGNMFFNVSESLKSDESLNIRTSTMVTGIRGTSGGFKILDSHRTLVYALSGRIECLVMDPVSGQTKTVILYPGERAEFIVYDQSHAGDKCDIIMSRVDEDNVDGFIGVELINDPEWRAVVEASVPGVNWETVARNAEQKLREAEQTTNAVIQAVEEQRKQQDNKVSMDPLFGDNKVNNDDDDSSGSGGSGDNSPEPEDPQPPVEPDTIVRLTVEEAELDNTLNDYLAKGAEVTEIIINQPDANGDTVLNLTQPTTLSANQKMTLDGVDLFVEDGVDFVVNDTLTVDGSVTNQGTITNTSMESFVVTGSITNEGTIDNTGKIVIGADANGNVAAGTNELLRNTGIFTTEGNVLGSVAVDEGEMTVAGGEVTEITFNGGNLLVSDGSVGELASAVSAGVIEVSGGTIDQAQISSGFAFTGGTIGTLTITDNYASRASSVSGGVITDGLKVLGDGTVVDISGGTISAGTQSAAVLVNATAPGAGSTMTQNVIISGGTIDGQSKKAIQADLGLVQIDMSGIDSVPVIKAENAENLMKIPAADESGAVAGDVIVVTAPNGAATESRLSQSMFSVYNGTNTDGKREYSFREFKDDILASLQSLTAGEYLRLTKDVNLDGYDEIEGSPTYLEIHPKLPEAGTNLDMAVLDLNGHDLILQNYHIDILPEDPNHIGDTLEHGMKICDTSGNTEKSVMKALTLSNSVTDMEISDIVLDAAQISVESGNITMYNTAYDVEFGDLIKSRMLTNNMGTVNIVNSTVTLDRIDNSGTNAAGAGTPGAMSISNSTLNIRDIYNSSICNIKGSSVNLEDLSNDSGGILTFDGCDVVRTYQYYDGMHNSGTINIIGGTFTGTDSVLVLNVSGETNISDGAVIKNIASTGETTSVAASLIVVYEGTVNIEGTSEKPVVIESGSNEPVAVSRLNYGWGSLETVSEETSQKPTLNLKHVTITSTGSAGALRADDAAVVNMGEGTILSSSSDQGTIYSVVSAQYIDTDWEYAPLELNLTNGVVENTGAGSAIYWKIYVTQYESAQIPLSGQFMPVIEDINAVEIKAKNPELFKEDAQDVNLGEMNYGSYAVTSEPDADGYYKLILAPSTFRLFNLLFSADTDSNGVGENNQDDVPATDSDAEIFVSTDSNAEISDGTDSREESPLETSKAAIPMAAVLLGMMAMTWNHDGKRKKNRKER